MPSKSSENSDRSDVCIDASVWVRLLTEEPGSGEVRNFFRIWLDEFDCFVAPSLLIFEVCSAIRKKCRLGLIGYLDANRLIRTFYRYPILVYQTEKLLRRAFRVAREMEEMVLYDSVYLALAMKEKVPFYTADVPFFRKAQKIYPHCHLV